eukprot:jgi/Orpsp1_1/1190121/evm.model.d7180000076720.1
MILFSNTQNIINDLLLLNDNYTVYDVQQHNYEININTLENINEPDDICYVLFTSGTTGKPKGALITHFNIQNYTKEYDESHEYHNIYNIIKKEKVNNILGITNFSFDASQTEIIVSLVHGLKFILIDELVNNDILMLSKCIKENDVHFINTTPTRIKLFMEYDEFRKSIENVKMMYLGGESLPINLCKYIHNYSSCKIYNSYGPTECTVDAAIQLIEEEKNMKITIGKPIRNCKIYILDKYLNPVPIGVEGEIYIGGYGVGKGYLNREDLTNKMFIKCPFNDSGDIHNEIMYKTGDLGKWTRNGEIEYLGRNDFQVKIHGQRIELEEIEILINEIKEIKHGVVIDKKKSSGEKYLVCYYQLYDNNIDEISGKDIRQYLKNKLPTYMIPNYYKKINEIPLSISGKLNRKELPEIDIGDIIKEDYVGPETEIEKCICHMYSKLFNINENEIGKTNDFLELGGDSLNAIRLISMIEKEFNVKLNIKKIFENSLIVDLSKYIEEILNDNNINSNNIEIIQKRNSKEFPITSQQLGVYIDSIKNENSIIYNIPSSYKLNNNININIIKEAFNKLFQNQEILRTKYYSKEINGIENIYGFVDDECVLEFEEYSFDNALSFIRPFKLSEAPLIRVGFIEDKYLLMDMHHIISDGATELIIMNELTKYYNERNISELEIQYSDYAIDMKEKQDNGFYDKQIEFYKEIFNIDYELIYIPKKEFNKKEINNNIDNYCIKYIDKITSDKINEFIKKQGITKTSLFMTIYGYILYKYSGKDVIYTSIINANRSNRYVENMAGMFVSTLPILLKYNYNNNNSFNEIIKENMNVLMDILSNQSLSLAALTKKLQLKKINNSFTFQPKISTNEENPNQIKIFSNKKDENENIFLMNDKINNTNNNSNSKFDIDFNIIETDNGYLISITFNNSLYDIETIDNLIDSFIEVTKNINKYENNIQNIEYIPLNYKNKIINEFNSDIAVYENEKLYHEEFQNIAKQYPEKCAIVYNGMKISYKELNEKSNSLANIIRKYDIGRNDIIPIISDRSPYYIISVLAISKAGGAFLPIDPKLPIERIQFILEEVKPKMILFSNTQNIINDLLLLNDNYTVYDVQQHNYEININSLKNINEPDDICYVLFTSGTTGKPKGTLITHFNIYNNIRKFENEKFNNLGIYNLLNNKKINNILGITNFSFDISHNEITFSLIHGLTIILVEESISENTDLLSEMIIKNNVDFINTTPTRFKLFMENKEFKKSLKIIKAIVFIGEELPLNLCKTIHQYSDCKIINGYGPTECTVTCTYKEIDLETENKITIGKPQCNYKIYILDKYLNPVPIGVEGEIYIGGYGVGKGYLNREDLTIKMFIKCPFNDSGDIHNEIMYKTGDLGKWIRNGEIEYLGRTDFQVKIHGQRIELGEIESLVNEIKEIKHGIVIDKKKSSGEKYLVCYYQLYDNDTNEISGKDIRQYLKNKLPTYMIPNYCKKISEIPLSISGKLNRKELPEINMEDIIKEDYVAPETEIEKCICHMYSKLFNINENEIGKTNDFLELGGDSLNAIRLISMIKKELNVKLSIKEIYENSLLVDLSSYIEEVLNNNNTNSNNIEIIQKRNSKEFPITSQQLGVYIDSIKNENSIIYNIPSTFKLNNNINIDIIKEGFNKIFQNQEILRTKYYSKEINGIENIYGFVDDECTLKFEEYTYDNVSSFIRPFKLSEAPLIRVGFIKNQYLLIDMHHIISDGSTMLIIMNELNKYYNERNISELEIQFSDYAIHMNEMKNNSEFYTKQIEFYKEMFNKDYEITNIPHKKKTNESNGNENENSEIGSCISFIDNITSERINEYIRINRISKAALFISIYGYVLSKYSGQETIYTSMISAGRSNQYFENMIGMFVSTQPILLKYDQSNISFLDIIEENMKTLIELYNNQDISFSELVNILKLKKINNAFIFQPKSIVENASSEESIFLREDDQKIYTLYEEHNELQLNDSNNTKFDITFNVIEREKGYLLTMDYNKEMFESSMIEKIINSCVEMIHHLDKFNENIQEIEYIPKEEVEKIISKFNENENNYDCDKLYHVEFNRIAKENDNKIAIVYDGIEIRYSELDKMSNSLGHYLRDHNIGRGDIIPIICERSYYYIIAFLSILKSGAAYIPIDPDFPKERIEYMINEVNAKFVLKYITNFENDDKITFNNVNVYSLDKHNYNENIDPLNNINESDDLCYVLFTSGTTGKPKGTLITHKNLVNYCLYAQTYNGKDIYGDKFDNVLAFSKFTFDMSLSEIQFPLLRGCKIILCNENEYNNSKLLCKLIKLHNVYCIYTVPSRLESYIKDEEFLKSLINLKWILLGGEKLNNKLINIINSNCNAVILNGYGPTETTVCSSIKYYNTKIKGNDNVTIGKPNCNYKIYILDRTLKPVPIGVTGEIFISGYGVGKGYLNRPELTKEKFIECPYCNRNDKPSIMYRTGDIGRWTSNGEIECLGRIDFQVKIRGQRIELHEIENIVKEMKEIEYSVVIDQEYKNGDKYLICYYISNNEIESKKIREYLNERLPKYMIPNYYKRIFEIPLSNSGKLNRRALPELTIKDMINDQYEAPETNIEKIICNIFSEIFNIPEKEVGRTSDFYEMGGDSLNAIRISSMIEKKLQLKVNIRDIMKYSQICNLGKYIDELLNSNEVENIIEIIEKHNSKEFPITSQQLGVYIDSIKHQNNITYNVPACYKLNENIDIEKIKKGFNYLLRSQEIFRTKYLEKEVNGKTEIYGYIDDDCKLEFEEYTNDNAPLFIRPFDLSKAPLMRVGFIGNQYLLIDTHHIISDGATSLIIINELNKYYNDNEMNELDIQYSDYAIHINEKKNNGYFESQIEFYKEMFSKEYEIPNIPKKNKNININNQNEDSISYSNTYGQSIDEEISKNINEFIKDHSVSKTAFFISIYGY